MVEEEMIRSRFVEGVAAVADDDRREETELTTTDSQDRSRVMTNDCCTRIAIVNDDNPSK
jgi:hypothetical protein